MNNLVTFSVNGLDVRAEAGSSLLEALLREGFDVPHLCHHEAVTAYGSCRLCICEITKHGRTKTATTCNYPVSAGIEVATNSEKITHMRKTIMELLLASAPANASLKDFAADMGVHGTRFSSVDKDNDCILCGLCERVCSEIVGVNAICFNRRGGERKMATPFVEQSKECIACGACVYVCPVSCIKLEQTATMRRIDRWGKVAALQRSKDSNVIFAPRPQLEYFMKLVGLPADFYNTAPGERPPERE